MEIGDKVKVVRIDEYTEDVCRALGITTSIGMVGTVVDKRYNHNMHRMEIIVDHQGDQYIWEEWNLMRLAD